jgi:mRNA interferase HigB
LRRDIQGKLSCTQGKIIKRKKCIRIISEKPLREFWRKYSDVESLLREWIRMTKAAQWNFFADVRNTFRSADIYQICTIFDIGGNKYRLITKIR